MLRSQRIENGSVWIETANGSNVSVCPQDILEIINRKRSCLPSLYEVACLRDIAAFIAVRLGLSSECITVEADLKTGCIANVSYGGVYGDT